MRYIKHDYFFILLMSLFPLFLGGNRPFSIAIFGLLASINLLLIAFRYPFNPLENRKIFISIVISSLLLAYILISAFLISPNHVYPLTHFLKYYLYYVVFLQAIFLCFVRGFMINLIKSLMWMGLIYSIYGIIALEFGDRILWYEKTSYQGYLTSVFINRNHFAFYGCISLLSSFYMFIKQLSDSDIKLSFINIIEFISSKGLIPIISILIIITAIFKTGSRGSIVLLITGFSTMFFLWFYKAKNYISKKQKYYCWFLFIVFITLLLFSINETISKRFHYLGNSLDERIAVWKICWKIFIQNPLFGYGAGEFENMFNSVRDLTISPFKRWDKAHNDYLEIIIEYGIFYGAIFWGFILWMIFHIFKSLNFPSRLFGRNILFIAVIAMLFVHSLFDFGGQMPAIAFIIITLTTSAFIRSV